MQHVASPPPFFFLYMIWKKTNDFLWLWIPADALVAPSPCVSVLRDSVCPSVWPVRAPAAFSSQVLPQGSTW